MRVQLALNDTFPSFGVVQLAHTLAAEVLALSFGLGNSQALALLDFGSKLGA